MIEVKIATIEDVPAIALLGRTTFTESFGHLFRDHQDLIDFYEQIYSVAKIKEGILDPNRIFWVAKVDDLPVGFAILNIHAPSEFISLSDTSQLHKIYVLKDFISKKIGLRLQDKLIEKAKELGTKQIWLSAWKGNERGINFYLKNDFEKIGDHLFTIGKETFDFMAMAKTL